MKCDIPEDTVLTFSFALLQLSFGLPATSAGHTTRPSAAGRQRTLAFGGRSSPAANLPTTPDPPWTTQVRTLQAAANWTVLQICKPLERSYARHLFVMLKLSCPTGESGNFIYTLATGPQETKVARLVSPVVSSPDSDLCVSFWYHMVGSHIGTLHIKQRKQTVDGQADILLWTLSGHQGNRWREGRVLVPRTNKPYQVNHNRFFFSSFSSVTRLGASRHTCALSVIEI